MQIIFVLDANNLNTPFHRFVFLLKKEGMNGAEIAAELPVSESTVSRWLSGETKHVNKEKCKQYASILGLDVEFIDSGRSQVNDPEVQYAAEVDLPINGKLSADQIKKLLGQIESIARILKDSL